MKSEKITRNTILSSLIDRLEITPFVHALWEGGSAAFGRADQWSDIDIQLAVDEDQVEAALALVEEILTSLSPLDIKFRMPEPTWHGFSQTFFRLANASKFLVVDCAVMKLSAETRFMHPIQHGTPIVHFDRMGFIRPDPFSEEAHTAKIKSRLVHWSGWFEWTQVLPEKEIWRDMPLDAFHFYYHFSVAPLVELLRIKHDPLRFNYSMRYLAHDLPPEVYKRLIPLVYSADLGELLEKQASIIAWVNELLPEMKERYGVQ